METAFVTGAGGFIGNALVHALAARGYKVYALYHTYHAKTNAVDSDHIIALTGDLNEAAQCQKPVGAEIDVFFHLAWKGISSADYKSMDVQRDNFKLSICAMKLAVDMHAKKFVFVGTNQEYLMDENCVDGKDSLSSVYGICKRSARELCAVMARNSMEFCATAFTNVFGIGDYSKRTANLFISKLLRNEPLDLIEGTHLYDWTFIDDAVDGLIAVGEKGVNGRQYYIGSRTLSTFREIVQQVQDTLAPNAVLNFGKFSDTSYTDYTQFDLDALYRDTGFECQADFKESILKTAQWLKETEGK